MNICEDYHDLLAIFCAHPSTLAAVYWGKFNLIKGVLE